MLRLWPRFLGHARSPTPWPLLRHSSTNASAPPPTHALALTPAADTLRPYQRACIEAIRDSLDRGKRPAVSLPTGSGKTHVFSYLLQHVRPRYAEDVHKRTKVLVIVNRKELIDQSVHRLRETHPHLTVLPIAGKQDYSEAGDVFVSTYQTLVREARLETIDPDRFKLIVIDEAHHSVAASYIRILSHFNAVAIPEQPPETPLVLEDLTSLPTQAPPDRAERETDPVDRRVHVVGFSATFWRNDSEFLRDIYDEIAFHENVNSMIDQGYLCPAKITKIKLKANELKRLTENADSQFRSADFFQHPNGLELVFNAWNANSHHKSTVVFGANLAHLSGLSSLFRQNGVDARIVHGSMRKAAREDVLARFARGEFPVLMNCQVLTEGTDIPRIDQIIIARGISSTGLAMQMIGRGLRTFKGKPFCNVVIFPNFAKFEGNLNFLPQLESMFPRTDSNNESAKGPEIDALDEDDDDSGGRSDHSDLDLDIDYGKLVLETQQFKPSLLISETYRPSHPLKSALLWTEWKKIYYLFPIGKGSYYSIKRLASKGLWVASFVKQVTPKFTKSQPIITSSTLTDVLLATEKHALAHWGAPGVRPLSKASPWLHERPTPKQLEALTSKEIRNGSQLNRGVAFGLLNLNSIGCKLTPELVQTLQNLIGSYKTEQPPRSFNKFVEPPSPPRPPYTFPRYYRN